LYEDTKAMIHMVGNDFAIIISCCFDLEVYKNEIAEERLRLNDAVDTLRKTSKMQIVEPKKDVYEIHAEEEVQEMLKSLKKQETDGEFSVSEKKIITGKTKVKKENDNNEEYRALMESSDALAHGIRLKHNSKFAAAYGVYELKVERKNSAIEVLDDSENALKKLLVVEDLIAAYSAVARKIVSKVRDVVISQSKYHFIKFKLQEMAKLRVGYNSETHILNPFDHYHLSGVFQLLIDHFQKRTFVNFATSLLEAMSWEMSEWDTENNPTKGPQEVLAIYRSWKSRGLFEQMAEDIFFTVILTRGIPQSQLRKDVITKITEFIHSAEKSESISSDPLFIFNQVTDYIKVTQDNKKLHQKPQSNNGGSDKISKTRFQQTTNNAWANSKASNVEQAHAVADSSSKAAAVPNSKSNNSNSSSSASSPPAGGGGNNPNSNRYNGEVSKDMKISAITAHGKSVPYLAVREQSSVCPQCFGGGVPCSKGMCFRGKCDKCMYYGHSKFSCMQASDVHGAPLSN
jgi:hypothetical protein